MTPPIRPGNQLRRIRLGLGFCALVMVVTVCTERAAARPPRAEFIVAAGDSSYWVHSDGGGVKLRGSPIVLARIDSAFLELYVVDDDESYENAEFVGQRLYERDLVLLRPDQHVAWRGDTAPADPLHVIDRVRGAHA